MANQLYWTGFSVVVAFGLTGAVGCGSEAEPSPTTSAAAGTTNTTGGNTSNATAGPVTSNATSASTSTSAVTSNVTSAASVTSTATSTSAATTTGTSTTGAAGGGVIVGEECRLLCADDSTDDDGTGTLDGWGFENGQSCVVPGGAADSGMACSDPIVVTGPDTPSEPGTGVTIGADCRLVCLDAMTDDDGSGALDGWGWERGQSCVVPGSTADPGAGNECELTLVDSTPGGMVEIDGVCTLVCMDATSDPDGDGWGYDDTAAAACVVAGGRADTGTACTG